MELRDALKAIHALWEAQIEVCKKTKQTRFGETAEKLWGFLGKSYSQLYLKTSDESNFSGLYYKPRCNKSREYCSVMIPHIFQRGPHRLVTPSRPPVPEAVAEVLPLVLKYRAQVDRDDQLRAWLMTWFQNYATREYGHDREVLTALPEGLVKGRAVLWHEMVDAAAGPIPASLYGSVDDLLIDGDTKTWRDAGFIMRRRERSVWRVSEHFGIPREQLRAVARSHHQQASDTAAGEDGQPKKDVCVYWEVFSRMGIGHYLPDMPEDLKPMEEALNKLGPHVWLAIMPGMEYPLNLQPDAVMADPSAQGMIQQLAWPIAYYEEPANPWPCTPLDFIPNPDNPWSTSELEAGLPMQVFLDHMYAFLMHRIRTTSRTIYVVSEALQEEFKQALVDGMDQEVAFYAGKPGADLSKLLTTLEFPEVNKDVWAIVQMVERAFERATALEPLLYGAQEGTQVRSATEYEGRQAHVTSRPDQMRSTVQQWLSDCAAKEGQAARLMVHPYTIARLTAEPVPKDEEDITPPGPLTEAWQRLVQTKDPAEAAAELAYTIEAGVADRKNKQKQAADAAQLVQVMLQPLMAFGSNTGNMQPYNALVGMLGEAMEMPLDRLMLPDMEPPVDETTSSESSG
ncbi:MAG: hypothetical protein ACYS7M_06765 [Planctomycetota bacterium]|jgi:hypothetical protein